jgi:hypothetical protein
MMGLAIRINLALALLCRASFFRGMVVDVGVVSQYCLHDLHNTVSEKLSFRTPYSVKRIRYRISVKPCQLMWILAVAYTGFKRVALKIQAY